MILDHPPDYTPPGTPQPTPATLADIPPVDMSEGIHPTPQVERSLGGAVPSVSVLVLNYNGLRHLETCFTSLLALDYPRDRLEIALVDNSSLDASLAYMREHFPTVRIIETGGNLGFAAGNNYGAEHATGEYIAFLNNDTRVEPDWLSEMVQSVEAGKEEGVVCTSSLMLDWEGKRIDFQSGVLNFHGFGFQPSYGARVEEQDLKPRDLLFACGGSMLIRRDVFLQAGGFDPDFWAYFEDVDLGWRLWLLGHRITLTPTAITYHRHHGSFDTMSGHRVQVLYERNALYTIYKNYEQASLDKILPAALLLLGQRAVRFMELGGVTLSDYDFTRPPTEQAAAQDGENVHRSAMADLLAIDEFRANLDAVEEKRLWIQANRRRTDAEMWALFGRPGRVHLINHETDGPYTAAHHTMLHEFGIEQMWEEMPREVLVISPDVLPVGDIPASGSGIRAWALGKGLESRGHHVRFTMPAAAIYGREKQVPPEYVKGAWTPENLQSIVDALVPDVVVSCGWPNLTWLPRANVPIALDLAGPHLLERVYQEYRDVDTNSAEKLQGIGRADFFTCIGERQRYYFIAWLTQAGVSPGSIEQALRVIPYSLDPQQPEHRWPQSWQDEQVHFVYGGIFLPWQNPAPALLGVAQTLADRGGGRLEVIGGKHPFHSVQTGSFGPLVDKLAQMPSVDMSGLLPHDTLVERYTKAHVAVDVMMPNAERELAFPSRTVHYMWCGLPVIHAAFSEVASYIEAYEAGWVVPHDSPEALREVVESILANPQEAQRRGHNAQRLAREHFSWDITVDALDKFVRSPYIRPGRTNRSVDKKKETSYTDPTRHVTAYGVVPATAHGVAGARREKQIEGVHEKRRTLAAQIKARSAEIARSVAPSKQRAGAAMPEIIAGHSLGQRFYATRDGLSGVRVAVNTFGRRNTSRLFLRLRDNPGATDDMYHIEIPTFDLAIGQTLLFRFPPIAGSAGRWFYFVAESPDGVPGDAISLLPARPGDEFPAQRYEDGLPAQGRLRMSLEYGGGQGE